jgi:hypothetical protein
MAAPPAPVQRRVLTARYTAALLADWKTLVLLVGQAPLIGWLCTVVWGSVETDTPSLRFVLVLAAVWFGCIDGCREIVKERAIFERERLLGVAALPYVSSKVAVLAGLVLAQVVLLQLAVEWQLALRGPLLVQTAALFLAGMCGVGLGLVVSALASTQERAVGVVPLLLLPQILFSELAIPRAAYGVVVERVELVMPVRWAYRVFAESAALEPGWGTVALSLGVLAGYAALLAGVAALALTPRREVA